MTERAIPTEGAPACPFVAFEDDRDGRSTAPDHRHRCFAEPRPAPRALAHQEAYCLSSAFPVCPTFQDWARREAAAARTAAPAAIPPRDETPPPQSRPMPPLEREPYRPPAGEPYRPPAGDAPPATAIPPRKPQQRDWAAPPPWAGDGPPPSGAAMAGAASAGAAAGALWGVDTDGPPRDAVPGVPAKDAGHPAKDSGREPDDWGSEAQGLAGSAAHRLAGPDPDEPGPARPDPYGPDDLDDAWAAGGAAAGAYVAGSATARPPAAASRDVTPSRGAPASRRIPVTRPSAKGGDQARRVPQPDAQELFGPAWERPRRYEAYPTLRTRIGLPALGGVPRIAVLGGLLVVAALMLFLFGPNLLGLAGQDDGGGAGASPITAASEGPSASVEAATQAPPTPQVYVVAKGDTMSKIAKRFGLTVAAIMAANPKIKNPNRIKVGDKLTIPVPAASGAGGVSPSRGTVSGASEAP